MSDTSVFPDPVYKETVLAPLFEGVKKHFAGHMASINRAHLVMLSETGILQPATATELARALQGIDADVDITSLRYTGEHEDYFFLVEAELRRRLGDLGGMLHTARSRNDMDHTVFKLALQSRAGLLQDQALDLANHLLVKAEQERDTIIVAYTHGQPAQPSTFGHYISALLEVLLRDCHRLDAAIAGLEKCPMGAAAITTSGFPINRHRVAELLGFAAPQQNSYGCIAAVDYITGLYSAIKLMFVHLGRVIQDLAFWSAFEVGQLYVPNSLVQISSIMPQKRNPVPIEHARHLASVTAGRCDMVVDTMHNTPFTDMNDSEGEVQQSGFAVFESGGRVLELLQALLPACTIDSARVAANADRACITITELADTLVRDEQLSFRQAHEIASQTAAAVIAQAAPLRDGYDVFSAAFEHETGRPTTLDVAQFMAAVDADVFVRRRDRHGGPAPAAMDAAFDSYRQDLAKLTARQSARQTRSDHAAAALDSAFTQISRTI